MKTPQLPVPALASAIGLTQELWLKREDLHHHGSHKGRSIPLMIDQAAREGVRHFIISSSGNAALSAIITVQNHNKSKPADPYHLTIYMGERLEGKKLLRLNQAIDASVLIALRQVPNPKQAAFLAAKKEKTKLLRQSIDPTALLGYMELAKELGKIPELSAVFIPTSSGTAAEGLYLGFQKLNLNPAIHIIQTPNCHPLADVVNGTASSPAAPEHSLATAIVDLVAHRAESVREAVQKSNGAAWIATNEEITAAINAVATALKLHISPTSALSVAGVMQALKNHRVFNGPVACLITGN